jgi:hypothetical protein
VTSTGHVGNRGHQLTLAFAFLILLSRRACCFSSPLNSPSASVAIPFGWPRQGSPGGAYRAVGELPSCHTERCMVRNSQGTLTCPVHGNTLFPPGPSIPRYSPQHYQPRFTASGRPRRCLIASRSLEGEVRAPGEGTFCMPLRLGKHDRDGQHSQGRPRTWIGVKVEIAIGIINREAFEDTRRGPGPLRRERSTHRGLSTYKGPHDRLRQSLSRRR